RPNAKLDASVAPSVPLASSTANGQASSAANSAAVPTQSTDSDSVSPFTWALAGAPRRQDDTARANAGWARVAPSAAIAPPSPASAASTAPETSAPAATAGNGRLGALAFGLAGASGIGTPILRHRVDPGGRRELQVEPAQRQVPAYHRGILARELALRRQRHVQHELELAQLRAQRFGQSREVVPGRQKDVGIGLFQALVDIGLHHCRLCRKAVASGSSAPSGIRRRPRPCP